MAFLPSPSLSCHSHIHVCTPEMSTWPTARIHRELVAMGNGPASDNPPPRVPSFAVSLQDRPSILPLHPHKINSQDQEQIRKANQP